MRTPQKTISIEFSNKPLTKSIPKTLMAVPEFVFKNDFKNSHNPFALYQLQKSWLNCNQHFEKLVAQLSTFNKEILSKKNKIQSPNYFKTYYLYKNLYQRFNDLNSVSSNLKQTQISLQCLHSWFQQLNSKTKQSKLKSNIFPGIRFKSQQDQQHLRNTMRNIKNRKQWQSHQIMVKSAYSQYFPSKDRTSEYKKQIYFSQMSENTSVASENSLFKSNSKINRIQSNNSSSKLGNKFHLQSTAYNSRVGRTASSVQIGKIHKNQIKPKIKPFQDCSMSQKNKRIDDGMQFNNISSNQMNKLRYLSSKEKKNNYFMIDQMIFQDKIQRQINQPDPHIHKNLSCKDIKSFQVNSTKISKISFALKTEKHQFIDRKNFMNIDTELKRWKKSQAQSKTNLSRKLQFRKYFSNHIASQKRQVFKDKKFQSLTKRVGSNLLKIEAKQSTSERKLLPFASKPLEFKKKQLQRGTINSRKNPQQDSMQKLNIIHSPNIIDPIEQKKKDFQQSIRKKSLKQTLAVFSKYIDNHLNENGPIQNQESKLSKTNSSGFSKVSSRFANTRQSFLSQSQKKILPLTSFKNDSLQKKYMKQNKLVLTQVLSKYTPQNYNQQSVQQVLKLKLKLAKFNLQNDLTVVPNSKISKALAIDVQNYQQKQFELINSKLLSNPFFAVKKGKKGQKKKSKR